MGLGILVILLVWLGFLFRKLSEPVRTEMQPRPKKGKANLSPNRNKTSPYNRLIAK
jgi:hypothetical protein